MRSIAITDIVVGLGLLFFFEGLILAGAPAWLKRAMEAALATSDWTLRVIGLISALCGLVLVWYARH